MHPQTKLYNKVPRQKAIDAGAKVISVRWIDVNKGDAKNPNMRSRVVGKEFNTYNDVSLYAGTPPLEALRLILHLAATNQPKDKHFKLMTNDVSRAYFYAPTKPGQYIYVQHPPEDKGPGRRTCAAC